jgi:hypothetical protein
MGNDVRSLQNLSDALHTLLCKESLCTYPLYKWGDPALTFRFQNEKTVYMGKAIELCVTHPTLSAEELTGVVSSILTMSRS